MPFFAKPRPGHILIALALLLLLLTGCAQSSVTGQFASPTANAENASAGSTEATSTRLPAVPTSTPAPLATATPRPVGLWISDALPAAMREKLQFPETVTIQR